jgi:hypothetical protein
VLQPLHASSTVGSIILILDASTTTDRAPLAGNRTRVYRIRSLSASTRACCSCTVACRPACSTKGSAARAPGILLLESVGGSHGRRRPGCSHLAQTQVFAVVQNRPGTCTRASSAPPPTTPIAPKRRVTGGPGDRRTPGALTPIRDVHRRRDWAGARRVGALSRLR